MTFLPRISKIPLSMTLIGVALLLYLGTWQLYRLQWKENLVKTFQERLSQPYKDFSRVQKKEADFTPVVIKGHFVKEFALKLQGRSYQGQVGYHLIGLLKTSEGDHVLVDRGWMPLAVLPDLFSTISVTVKGYIRSKSDQNFMTPLNDYKTKDIYRLNPQEIEQKFQFKKLAPFYIVETGPILKNSYPYRAQPYLQLRNNHLQYAVTWYALAFALIIIYILFRHQQLKSRL